jgi:hypothetical protein
VRRVCLRNQWEAGQGGVVDVILQGCQELTESRNMEAGMEWEKKLEELAQISMGQS